MATWTFRSDGPDTTKLKGPVNLASRGLPLPKAPGFYLVTCGDCLAHIGSSKSLAQRVRKLARLDTHRGSSEVLCGAFCSGDPPQLWWEECPESDAELRERAFKKHYGEPPCPREKYGACKNGSRLRERLIESADRASYEAGYIDAVFDIGEKLQLLFHPRFERIWKEVGIPPGPWAR